MSFHDRYEARLLRVLHVENSTADSTPGPRCLVCRLWSQPCPACRVHHARILPRPTSRATRAAAAFRSGGIPPGAA